MMSSRKQCFFFLLCMPISLFSAAEIQNERVVNVKLVVASAGVRRGMWVAPQGLASRLGQYRICDSRYFGMLDVASGTFDRLCDDGDYDLPARDSRKVPVTGDSTPEDILHGIFPKGMAQRFGVLHVVRSPELPDRVRFYAKPVTAAELAALLYPNAPVLK